MPRPQSPQQNRKTSNTAEDGGAAGRFPGKEEPVKPKKEQTGFRHLATALACVLLALSLGGCSNQSGNPDPAQWRSWRIGVPLAWGADYYLTDYEKLPLLYRYDDGSECLMGLKFGYIDAIVVDDLYAREIVRLNPELTILDEPVGQDQSIAYVSTERQDLLEEINDFIPDFRESGEYADLCLRSEAGEFVPNEDIPAVEDGPLLRVALAVSTGNYPYAYYDFNTDSPQGVDVEFVKQFAAAYGYAIEWYDSDWDACAVALTNHQVDLFVGGCSVYYAKEEEEAGSALCSNPYFDMDLVLIVDWEEET